MSESNVPDGMISAESFAKLHGLLPENLIQMVKEGLYDGRIIDGKWYVVDDQPESIEKKNKIARMEGEDFIKPIRPDIAFMLNWLSVLSLLAGVALGIAFLPRDSDLSYGQEWKMAAYAWSFVWITAGIVQAAIFAAIARIISLLETIAEKTEN